MMQSISPLCLANEFQMSSLTELFDCFGDSTLYKLPTATKA